MPSPEPPPRSPLPSLPPATARRWRRFLVVVAVLTVGALVAFRHVLFPFVMAAFLAYLVEPLIEWMGRGRHLGIRWGRAPVLILVYAVVITAAVGLVSCAAKRVTESARRAANDLERELSKPTPAVRFALDRPAPADVWIPEGTLVRERPDLDRPELRERDGRAWRTLFPEQIGAGLTEARALLHRDAAQDLPAAPPPPPHGPDGKPPAPPTIAKDERLEIVEPSGIEIPDGVGLTAKGDDEAKGLEIFTAKWVIAPVARQIERITGEHFDPGIVRDFVTERSRRHGGEAGLKVVDWSRGVLFGVVGSVYEFVLILMLAAFLVIDRSRIARFFAELPPPDLRPAWACLLGYVDRGLAGVIRGQLAICCVNGVLTWLGLLVLGVPYATLLGFVAGVFSLVPVFGTIASSVPIVLVALATGGLGPGLLALGWILVIHLLEANLFNPLIMGSSARLHPVVIIFALLAGEHAFGVWGALLAVPAASILISVFKYYRHEVLGVPPPEEEYGHGKWLTRLLARRAARAPAPPAGGAT